MRFKDFGCEDKYVVLKHGDVQVKTTTFADTKNLDITKEANKSHLSPWMISPDYSDENKLESYFFTIYLGVSPVGEVILWGFSEGDDDSSVCFISYWVDRHYLNKGIATKSVALCAVHAFENLNVDRIEAAIQADNFPSIRVAEKLGFKKVTTIEDYFSIDGKPIPHDLYALDRY